MVYWFFFVLTMSFNCVDIILFRDVGPTSNIE